MTACETTLELLNDIGDAAGTAYALYVLGLALHELRRYDEALARYRECLTVSRSIDLRDRETYALYRMAETLRMTGRLQEAVHFATRAVTQCEELDAARDLAQALTVLGRTLADLGHVGVARRHLERAQALFAERDLPEAAQIARLLDTLPQLPGA